MIGFPDRETVARLREQFPVGCRIVLDEMNDPYRHARNPMSVEN